MTNKVKTWWGNSKTWHHIALGVGLVLFIFIVIIAIIRITHYDKILPGVVVRNIYVGSLTKAQAMAKLNEQTSQYYNSNVSYEINGRTTTMTPAQMGVSFDDKAIIDSAFQLGRENDIVTDIANQTAMVFSDEDLMQLNVDKDKFSDTLINMNSRIATPGQNAAYVIKDSQVAVVDSKPGERIDMGVAIFGLTRQLSNLKSELKLPTVTIAPSRTTDTLLRQKESVTNMVKAPVALVYKDKSWEISRQQLLDWLYIKSQYGPLKTNLLNHYYNVSAQLNDFQIEKQNVNDFLGGVAGEINQEAIDAKLTINGGKAVVFKQSRDGRQLNIEKTTQTVIESIKNSSGQPVELVVEVKKADVSDDNIENLGIKELISEGVTMFPGSPSNRLVNVRVGMSKFNGILLKPGQVFSFGEFLGEVGPEQGYTPGLVILGDHEEKAYGGGLCQVSSTAYRAALLAGLPILERTNHAFAISYYTAPFGVPGVDATIYYPQVDMKFKNDTGHHILIQTEMIGTTLKFRYYGTKTKSGVIRGPSFVYGSHDETQPSQTVFYRDVLDLAGNVTKTDTINTYYKSSLDFPITD